MIEDLADFYNMFKDKEINNVKICLDTCHLFAAGYDLRTIEDVNNFILKFNKLIGLQYVGLVHLNDSIHDLDSHLDRHMNIGNGYIGSTGLKYFYQSFKTIDVPSILETPVENYGMEIKNLTN
jgi:apurinic endonuclease APN1